MVTAKDISNLSMFDGVPDDKLAIIAEMSEEIQVKAGEVIFCEGCPADKFYILLEGNISLWMKLTSRPESLVLGIINKRGQSFGWSVVVSAQHYTATAECKEDSKLLAFNGKTLMDYMKKDTDVGFILAMRMAEIVSSRLRYYRVLLKTF